MGKELRVALWLMYPRNIHLGIPGLRCGEDKSVSTDHKIVVLCVPYNSHIVQSMMECNIYIVSFKRCKTTPGHLLGVGAQRIQPNST